ncbi:MAG: Ig-like domain-containing protein [Vicinamibacterales bacterium]
MLFRTIFALLFVVFLAQTGGHAGDGGPLDFSRGFLVTGNYVVGGVDLTEELNPPDVDGLSTGIIHMSGVPANADILAAYLFWETITLSSAPAQAQVKFRGTTIDLDDASVVALRDSPLPLMGTTSTCWSSGVPLTSHMFRADVLALLPPQVDKDDKQTGKRLVNDDDLIDNGHLLSTVTLPTRNGNQIPESAGASLVVVYRDPSEPLRKVVIYDGIYTQVSIDVAMQQDIQGFYKSVLVPVSSGFQTAQITHIVASGQPNNNDKIWFNDAEIATNPFGGGTASQRAWQNPTIDVSTLMIPGSNSGIYGETVTTRVDHQPTTGGQDCLTWGAVVFSTAVADEDHDGLPDKLEDEPATGGLKDPDGLDLPNFKAMTAGAAGSDQPDIFIEVNAMWAAAGTTYGSVQDTEGHNHMPTPEVVKMIGDAYAARGIRAHFDIGDISAYHAPNPPTPLDPYDPKKFGVVQHTDWEDDYTSLDADTYLISAGVRGGELIEEKACVSTPEAPCHFPGYAGVVGWKFGLQAHRDSPVDDLGEEIEPAELDDWVTGTTSGLTTHRRRFDRARRGLFHYVLYAHARGKPKSPFPCLLAGEPVPYESGTTCPAGAVANPDFSVPSSTSGIGDQPGGNALITLGLWDEFVGRPFVRAATTFHELGHNAELWHGGLGAIWGNKALDTATYVEPNCKPFYLSSMSYLYQVHGLFDNDGNINLDYSSHAYNGITESGSLADGALGPQPSYQPAWYAPAGSALALSLGVSEATRFCSGAKFPGASPHMARVHTTMTTDSVDWNGDTSANFGLASQDVNFDNAVTGTEVPVARLLNGFNDWGGLRLDQIGAGHSVRMTFDGSGDTGLIEGDTGLIEGDTGLIEGDTGLIEGDTGLIEGDTGLIEGDTGLIEGDTGLLEGLGIEQSLTLDSAKGLGRPKPYKLTACVTGRDAGCDAGLPASPPNHRIKLNFKASTFGTAVYMIERKRGNASSTNPYLPVGESLANFFVDGELPNGIEFTYRARARFDDETPSAFSDWSNTATTTAVNDPPVAVANAYAARRNTTLNVAAPGVVGNDTDPDSPVSSLQAVLVGCNSGGTLTFGLNGAFSYRPKNGFTGTETCQYQANNGVWTVDLPHVPMSINSASAPITFTVTK